MKQFFFLLILLTTADVSAGRAAELTDAPLDVSGITAVAIGGDASSVAITTDPDLPHRATVRRHRSGWFAQWTSAWAYDDCGAASRMSIDGALLRIDVGPQTGFGLSDCRYDIHLNVRPQTAVAIHQQALQADLSGNFSALTITARAADISIDGHADSVSLQADALRLGLTFKTTVQDEVVSVDARMLEADFDFSATPTLAYSVTSKAAFVSSSRQTTPGAKPSLIIAGDLVHATIR